MHEFTNKFTITQAENMFQKKIPASSLNLQSLNDDCLLEIMNYLKISDVKNLSQSSDRFKSVAGQHYRKYKHFSYKRNLINSNIEISELPTILNEMGRYIETLELINCNTIIFKIFASKCTNVKTLKITGEESNVKLRILRLYKLFFRNISKIIITNTNLYDNVVRIITRASNLTSLELVNCENIKGKFLQSQKLIRNIRELKLLNCSGIMADEVENFEERNNIANIIID
jgi:hypothetical protein